MDALVDRARREFGYVGERAGASNLPEFLFIGELSRLVGVSPRAIRFYEKEGLITPARSGRFRVYRKSDEARLRLIGRLRALGLPVALIRDSLDHFVDLGSAHNRESAIGLLGNHLAGLERRQAELLKEQALTRALREELLDSTQAGDVAAD
jgi:DNA-binding transcriptional MerR regulator